MGIAGLPPALARLHARRRTVLLSGLLLPAPSLRACLMAAHARLHLRSLGVHVGVVDRVDDRAVRCLRRLHLALVERRTERLAEH